MVLVLDGDSEVVAPMSRDLGYLKRRALGEIESSH